MDERVHNIIIEERRKISVSAVNEVKAFDENEIVMSVKGATLSIKGEGLSIEELSIETGEAVIKGDSIDSAVYSKIDRERSREGFFGRLLK